jgi:anaerobic magnesium-protoporphyrin IX monomethyl ester cyclase
MNVLLVNPVFTGKSELPPLGLLSLAAVLLQENHPVEVLDLDIDPSPDPMIRLGETLHRFDPAVVGVTAMSDSFRSALDVCRCVKVWNPAALTVLGGVHATVHDERILASWPDVDIVVRGEGEVSFREVVLARSDGRPVSGIKGITHRDDGRVVRNPRRDIPPDLDAYPIPAHQLLEGEGYRARGVSSSRGCNHRCTFCSIRSLYGGTVRFRDIGSLMDEIELLADLGTERIFFSDDNFTGDAARAEALCREIARQGFHRRVRFFAEGRIDDMCRNPMLPGILSGAGFGAVYFGAESGSPEILEYYRKGIRPGDMERCVSLCVEQNLTPVVSFILLGPRDTVTTVRETLALAGRLFEQGAEIAYTEMLIPYPGTPIQTSLAKDGKFRRSGEVYYFESYNGMDAKRTLQLFTAARQAVQLVHRGESFAQQRRVYREFGYFDDLLAGKIPDGVESFLSGLDDQADAKAAGKQLHREMLRLVEKQGRVQG